MRRLFLSVVFSVSAIAAQAEVLWIAVDGSYDGDFSDSNHWKNGTAVSAGIRWDVDPAVNGSINFDTTAEAGYWQVLDSEPDAVTTVRWGGSGSMSNTGTSPCYVGRNRVLVVDGPSISVKGSMSLYPDSRLEVAGGVLSVANGTSMQSGSRIEVSGGILSSVVEVQGGSVFEMSGGVFTVGRSSILADEGDFVVSGGSVFFSEMPTVNNVLKDGFSFWGGRIVVPAINSPNGRLTTDDAALGRLMPPAGAVLDLLYQQATYSGNAIVFKTAGTESFDGTIYVTNRTDAVHPGVYWSSCNHEVGGRGTIVADRLEISAAKTATLGIRSVCLAYGLKAANDAAVFSFPDGIVFGAWDDWDNSGDRVPTVELAGDVVFDTRDCLGADTPRTISLTKVKDLGITSLKVLGGGSVSLAFTGAVPRMEVLDIAPEATLTIQAGETSILQVHRLALGAGATIRIAAGNVSVESQLSPVFGAGAKIEVSVPAGLQTGVRHPVFAGPRDESKPVSAHISYVGLDQPWAEKVVCNVHYLSDGTALGVTNAEYEWIGSTSSSWADVTNWSGEKNPIYMSVYAYFGQDVNPYVDMDVSNNIFRGMTFEETCGPYYLYSSTDASARIRYGSTDTPTCVSKSKFPAEIGFRGSYSYSGQTHAHFRCYGDTYLAVTGGGEPGALRIGGDVRLGGEWTTAGVGYIPKSDAYAREPSVSILPGAILTLTNRSAVQSAPARMTIDGTLEIQNTLSSEADAAWIGEGAVRTYSVANGAGASATLTLGDQLALYPMEGWTTVSPEHADTAFRLAMRGQTRLGAAADWTYGMAAGASSSVAPADRALTVLRDATVTIDTADPETGAGHVVTFDDPIIAEGAMTKIGAGTLVLNSEADRISSLRVDGGTVRFGAVQEIGSLVLADGALIEPSGSLARDGWVTVLKAKSITGLGTAMGGYAVRQVESDGLVLVQMKAKRGLLLIFR